VVTTLETAATVFNLGDDLAYRRWREQKLAAAPLGNAGLIVDVADPCALTAAERDALLQRCASANMAIYRSSRREADKAIPRRMAEQLGLQHLDGNWLADDDGISQIAVATAASSGGAGAMAYIPYTNRPIKWHTDGYYHPPARTIRAMILHCVRPAHRGGETALIDHELAYIAVRDANPEWVRALWRNDAMIIPARMDEEGVARAEQAGPVFSVDSQGHLHMRYTARTHSIEWNGDPDVLAAAAFLTQLLAAPEAPVWRLRLEAGMGLVCNNVLHDRAGFEDDPEQPRLLYRARYLDRIASPVHGDYRS
jgi:alpha-ketoglutarate-dependent taurine dioxygenase